MGLDVAVAIPWRPQPDRLPAYARVLAFWQQQGFRIVTGDSAASKPFNVAQARNVAVSRANAEVVVVCDADTLPDINIVRRACDEVRGEVIFPYTRWHYLEDAVDMSWDEMLAAPASAYFSGLFDPSMAVGGIRVCRSETYWRLGGHDEGFTSWGGEDYAFSVAAAALSGARRLPGTAVSMGHSVAGGRKNDLLTAGLRRQYEDADGDPDAMERLVAPRAVGVDEWKAKWPSPPAGRNWI